MDASNTNTTTLMPMSTHTMIAGYRLGAVSRTGIIAYAAYASLAAPRAARLSKATDEPAKIM